MVKKILVTGCTDGIGRDLCFILAHHRYDLLLMSRDKKKLEELKMQLNKLSASNIECYTVDAGDEQAIDALINSQPTLLRDVDVLVNNVGVNFPGSFYDIDINEHIKTIKINNIFTVKLSYYFLRSVEMKKQINKKHIVNVSSITAFFPNPYTSIYAASKAFLYSFSKAIEFELRGKIIVTTFCPGPIRTKMTVRHDQPMNVNLSEPNQVALQIFKIIKKQKGGEIIYPYFFKLLSIIFQFIPKKFPIILIAGKTRQMFRV